MPNTQLAHAHIAQKNLPLSGIPPSAGLGSDDLIRRGRLTQVADRYLAACGVADETERRRIVCAILDGFANGPAPFHEDGSVDMEALQGRIDGVLAVSCCPGMTLGPLGPGWGRLAHYWHRPGRSGRVSPERRAMPSGPVADMPLQDISPFWHGATGNRRRLHLQEALRLSSRLALFLISTMIGGRIGR